MSELELYRKMTRIRRCQQALMHEYHPADEMRTPVHFCVGQEGPAVGVGAALSTEDYLFTGHRSHGWYLAKGGSMKKLFAELYGKATGTNGGRSGSQELSSEEINFFSGTILAGVVPIAAGAALAAKRSGDGSIVVVVIGDGAADEGVVYETMNFASLETLPLLFISENNGYSVYSRQEDRQAKPDIPGRAKAFGLDVLETAQTDVEAIFTLAHSAVRSLRNGSNPILIELPTYRLCTHVGPEDDDKPGFRPAEEVAEWRKRDPLRPQALDAKLKSEEDRQTWARWMEVVDGEIAEAFEFAKSSPFPERTTLMRDVFSTSIGHSLPEIDGVFDIRPQEEAIPRPY